MQLRTQLIRDIRYKLHTESCMIFNLSNMFLSQLEDQSFLGLSLRTLGSPIFNVFVSVIAYNCLRSPLVVNLNKILKVLLMPF